MSDRVELPTAERAEKCGTCRFFDPPRKGDEDESGECRRYPPQPLADADDGEPADPSVHASEYWGCPVVWPEDWCGEWQPAK